MTTVSQSRALSWLLLFCLPAAGCFWQRHPKATPPPQAQAPAENPVENPVDINPPATQPAPAPAPTVPAYQPPQSVQSKPAQKKKKPSPATPATPDQQSAPNASQQTASNGASGSGSSAIGELASGNEAHAAETRVATLDLINSTEKRYHDLHNLSDAGKRTGAQIESFLKQARAALASNDLDGAHTLATKAKLLVDELSKQ
jgi:outer membrane biosynthesis protein TonB